MTVVDGFRISAPASASSVSVFGATSVGAVTLEFTRKLFAFM